MKVYWILSNAFSASTEMIVVFLFIMLMVSFAVKKHLSLIIESIEKGEGNLTERLTVKSQDEIGQLAMGINAFLDQLQGIMVKLYGYDSIEAAEASL